MGHALCSVVVPVAVVTLQNILFQPLSFLSVFLAAAGEWPGLAVL